MKFQGKTAEAKWVNGFIVGEGYIRTRTRLERVIPSSVGEFTRQTDRNGNEIYEGHILRFEDTNYSTNCLYEVKLGEYIQDGSGGEYEGTKCYGFYVELLKFVDLESGCGYDPNSYYPEYLKQRNILEIARWSEIVGHVCDYPEILQN